MSEEKPSPVGIIVVVAAIAGVMIGCSVTVATPPAKGQTLALEKTKPVEEETKFTEGELKIDGEIEAKIRQAINKPEGELTDEDLLKVTKINFQGRHKVSSFAPISRLKNLSDFRASGTEGNPITSLSFLDGLEKIHTIHLDGTSMLSVESLGKLPKLSELSLRGNKEEINDLTALGELPELSNVDLRGGKFTSIKGIGKSDSIKHLTLVGNLISDISGLAEMEQLQALELGGNPIMDISAIGQLGNLRYLNLQSGVPAKDWSPISRLKNLSDFRASGTEGNPITSLSFLDGLEKIHTIHLDGTKMDYSQVEAIQKALPNLREFKHDVKR